MGFLDKMRAWQADQLEKGEARLERLQAKTPVADYSGIRLYPDGRMTYWHGGVLEETTEPATARVETGAELDRRVTVTRLAAMGLFALRFKKETGGESWLTVENDTVFWVVEVDRKDDRKAREFAAAVNRASRVSA